MSLTFDDAGNSLLSRGPDTGFEDRMRLAFASTFDARDRSAFGGRSYYMARALSDVFEIDWIGPLSYRRHWLRLRTKQIVQRRVFGRTFWQSRDRALVEDYSRQIASALQGLEADVVFSPMSPGSQPVAYLECRQPIVIWTDATFLGWEQSFPFDRADMSAETVRDAVANEREALRRCALVIYSSDWAAESAISNYDIDPAKVSVVPFGANFEAGHEPDEQQILDAVSCRPRDVCRLLFVGTDWDRKGGDLAIRLAKLLNRRGLPAEVTLLTGHHRFDNSLPDCVRPLGFLDKSTTSGIKRWSRLLADSHFLVLPTRCDATPLILSEAAAFGVPCLTSAVGGIPTVIRNDVNGRMFPAPSTIDDYADYVECVFSDRGRYEALCLSSFQEYETRLNWSVAARTVKDLIANLVVAPVPREGRVG